MSIGKKHLIRLAVGIIAGLSVASAWALSPATVSKLKAKAERGEAFSSAEIRLARENPMQLSSVLRRQYPLPTVPRQPGNPLDIYVALEVEHEWIDITETGINANLFDETMTGAIPLGFDFPFYEQTYPEVWICDNGWVSFVFNWSRYWNDVIPDGFEPHCVAYCFWDDFDSGGGSVLYLSEPENGRFIVTWNNVPHYEDNSEFYTVQMVLYENGDIRYNYQSISDGMIGNMSCTVGIENENSTEALQVCSNGDGWLPTSGTSLLISQPDGVPSAPSELQGSVTDHDVSLSWEDPTQDTNGNPVVLTNVEVWEGTPTSGTLLGTLAPGVETYLVPGAAEGSRRYSVRAYSDPYYGTAASVVVLVGTPSYANNFDLNDGSWVSELGWQWGEATNPDVFPTYYSAPNVWGTGLESSYQDLSDWRVDLSPGLAISGAESYLEFYCYYDCEGFEFGWYDGCNLKISVDGGFSWSVLVPDGGYPASEIPDDWGNPLGGEPAWSGQSDGWIHVTVPLGDYAGEVPVFRFHLGTDNFVSDGYSGLFFDDLLIWGMAPPVFSTISGHVTFDGGVGNYSESLVRANGFGLPTAVPAGDGTFMISNVVTGQRQVTATHPDYHSATVDVDVPEGGATGVEITIVRLEPPAPTGLTGNVGNGTGVVTLDWVNSPDPLVDQYHVFRRTEGEAWSQISTTTVSNFGEILGEDGIYYYAVSAVDIHVSSPVESEISVPVTLVYGAYPAKRVRVYGDYDDRIRVTWLDPRVPIGSLYGYDDGTSENWYRVNFPNGPQDYFSVRFTPPDTAVFPLMLFGASIYMERSDPLPLVAICPTLEGSDGADLDNAWVTWEGIGADGDPGWLNAETDGSLFLTEPQDFWVVIQFPPGLEGPGCGSDESEPDSRSYWTNSYPQWNVWMWNDWMMRVWLGGAPPDEELGSRSSGDRYVLSVGEPGGYAVHRIPESQTAPTVSPSRQKDGAAAKDKSVSSSKSSFVARNPMDRWFAPYSRAPELEMQVSNHGNALDDITNFRVYRDNMMIAEPAATSYMDMNRVENTDYSYRVSTVYDNGEESELTPAQVGRCNMTPSAPADLQATPIGNSEMGLVWTAPTTNVDGTPLVDLANYYVWRDGEVIATVPAGTTTYIDTPPQNDYIYTWAITAQDEVPNVSDPSNPFEGAVVSPWEVVDIDWADISAIGEDAGISFDDQIVGPFELGFTVEFMGESYSSVFMCSNGWASFIENGFGYYFNTPIPEVGEPNAVMYLFWDDLYPPSGGQYKYYQDAANDRFIMSWIDVPHISNTACIYTFQIIIESDGGIIYNYLDICDDFPGNTWCTIGVENVGGSNAVELLFDGSGDFMPDDQTAVAFWAGPSGEITGLVREFGANTPLENASVTVAEVPELVALTDITGTYLLEVDPGTYTVTIHKQGYCDQVFPDVVVADETTVTRNAAMRQPNAHFNVTSLNILTVSGQSGSDQFEITNPGPATCEISYNISVNQPWLHLTPEAGDIQPNGSQTISVTADAQALQPGDYSGAISVSHNDHNSPYIIPVTLSVASDAPQHGELPAQFALHSNYPNPFNSSTSLRFDLPQESHVRLTIFNVQGREVARAVDETMTAGFHEVVFDAGDLPTGMYLIKMQAGTFSDVKKMALLK